MLADLTGDRAQVERAHGTLIRTLGQLWVPLQRVHAESLYHVVERTQSYRTSEFGASDVSRLNDVWPEATPNRLSGMAIAADGEPPS